MGMMNYAVNRLLERKDIFADFVNGALFGGHEMIRSQNLELMSPNGGTVYKDKNGNLKVRETQGDIRMRANEQLYSVIVAAEPQYKVHYAMPVRVMEYVAMEYRKQIQDLEKKYREQMNLTHIGEEEQIDFISGIGCFTTLKILSFKSLC